MFFPLFVIQIDKEQADLARANFFIIKKEAQGILDLVIVTCVLI
jgi:nuclear pore complex protein Nup205